MRTSPLGDRDRSLSAGHGVPVVSGLHLPGVNSGMKWDVLFRGR